LSSVIRYEVTPVLRKKGVTAIERQGHSIAISYDNKVIRSTFYELDFDKSMKALQKRCTVHIADNLIIQEMILIISKDWNEVIKSYGESSSGNNNDRLNTNVNTIYDEIRNDKAAIGYISQEEWKTKLIEKYDNLKKVIEENLPQLWLQIEFELSIKCIMNIKDCTLPQIVIVLGAPSSLKTQGIELLKKWPGTYYTDNFSARSFVSHNTSVKREELKEIDLLPKIKDKIFLTPELAPTFAAKDDDLIQILGIITRIADGHGYESDSGAHGHRGYSDPMMFVWIGAAVDIPRRVHKYLSTLGPKLYFLRVPKEQLKEEDYLKYIQGEDFANKINKIHSALFDYLKWFELCPVAIIEQSSGLPKVHWNDSNTADNHRDDLESLTSLVRLGMLLAHLRGSVPTWDTSHSQGSEYAYTIATIEEPHRAITQLRNMARGHALSMGRNFITKEDIPITIKVVLSTASIERVTIFDLLLAHGGTLSTPVIADSLNISSQTALRTMTEFKALGLVDMGEAETGSEHITEIILKPEFNWFLSLEFQKLRGGYKPECNKAYNKKDNKENDNIGSESIYKIFPGKWGCRNCRATGDKFFLEDHECRRKAKNQEGNIA
jgi:hypothetical protein